MKLNNLSRLTALLMAVMMLGVPNVSAAASTDLSELTFSTLQQFDAATEMIQADNRCSLCANEVVSLGILEWPLAEADCLHTYLTTLHPNAAYEMLITLYNDKNVLYDAYINAHQRHVMDNGDSPSICYDGCNAYAGYQVVQPGTKHSVTCPWYTTGVTAYICKAPTFVGDSALLACEHILEVAEDATLSYQWYYSDNSVDMAIEGATSAEMQVNAVTMDNVKQQYKCVVTVSLGGTETTAASQTTAVVPNEHISWMNDESISVTEQMLNRALLLYDRTQLPLLKVVLVELAPKGTVDYVGNATSLVAVNVYSGETVGIYSENNNVFVSTTDGRTPVAYIDYGKAVLVPVMSTAEVQ